VYTDETRNSPALLTIDYPDDWKVASQLRPLGGKSFDAETYDDLIDAPTIISPTLVHWQTKVRNAQIHIYFQNDDGLGGSNMNEEDVKADLAKIVEGQFALMQDVPFKEYAFIYHLVSRPFSHGVEHKNSASMVMGPAASVDQNYGAFLSLSSHEFFHVWNIKRIKPDVFLPYDYRKESYTPLLYVSEGFTSYYGSLTLARTKQTPTSNYLSGVGSNITALQNNYGRKVQPLALSSFDAWLSGYGAGRGASSVSFYSKGELIGLLIDLEIRQRTKNAKSLDDVMRLLNTEFAGQGRGFSARDFKELVERTGTGSFTEFFERFIYGTDELPFAEKLAYAGLELRKSTRGVVTGMLTADENGFPVVKSIEPESPAFTAGLDNGDVLIALNGKSLMNQSPVSMLATLNAGQSVELSYIRSGLLKAVKLTLKGRDAFSISKKATATAAEKAIFESWLAAKWSDVTI
ncbi:MAG: M61 family metallopeptidase, partial [Rhizobacter sp.]|nr:M61 family metallopeptidase [Chlorobiales bacterium]